MKYQNVITLRDHTNAYVMLDMSILMANSRNVMMKTNVLNLFIPAIKMPSVIIMMEAIPVRVTRVIKI